MLYLDLDLLVSGNCSVGLILIWNCSYTCVWCAQPCFFSGDYSYLINAQSKQSGMVDDFIKSYQEHILKWKLAHFNEPHLILYFTLFPIIDIVHNCSLFLVMCTCHIQSRSEIYLQRVWNHIIKSTTFTYNGFWRCLFWFKQKSFCPVLLNQSSGSLIVFELWVIDV